MERIRLDQIDSTNTYAKKHALEFKKEGITCITAEEQTAGRGRFERVWVSPKGVNLYVSFFFLLPLDFKNFSCLGHLAIHSLAQVLIQEGLEPKIKWPNDLLLTGKKLSGVLCELSTRGNSVEVILGIGINVNMATDALDTIDQPATSLLAETGHIWDKEHLLKALQGQLVHDLSLFKEAGFRPFHPFFNTRLAYRGKKVKVLEGEKEWIGICDSITLDGKLKIELENGEYYDFAAGILTPLGK